MLFLDNGIYPDSINSNINSNINSCPSPRVQDVSQPQLPEVVAPERQQLAVVLETHRVKVTARELLYHRCCGGGALDPCLWTGRSKQRHRAREWSAPAICDSATVSSQGVTVINETLPPV